LSRARVTSARLVTIICDIGIFMSVGHRQLVMMGPGRPAAGEPGGAVQILCEY